MVPLGDQVRSSALLDDLFEPEAWVFVLVAVVIGGAALAYWVAQSADFVIRRGRDRKVRMTGRIAASKRGAIKAFFDQDFGATDSFTVRGSFGPGRAVKLRFSGRLSRAQQQRARNFLVAHLR
jgi:hypothetical protein